MKTFKLMTSKTAHGCVALMMMSAALVATSCSDDAATESKGTPTPSITAHVSVNNDAASLAKRVTNFKNSMAVKRANVNSLTMPAEKEAGDQAVDLAHNSLNSWEQHPDVEYTLNEEFTVNSFNMSSNEIHVNNGGCLTLANAYGNGTLKVYVHNGGKFVWNTTGNKALPTGVELYLYDGAELEITGNDQFYLAQGSVVMTKGDLDTQTDTQIYGTLLVEGNLNASILAIHGNYNATAQVCVLGDTNVDDNVELDTNADVFFGGRLTAKKKLIMSNNSNCVVECRAEFGENITVTNSANLVIAGSVKANEATINASGHITLGSGAYAELNTLNLPNANTAGVAAGEEEYAVLVTQALNANMNDLRMAFTGHLGVHYVSLSDNMDAQLLQFQSNVKVNNDDDTYIAETTCTDAFGKPEAESKPVIEHLAEIANPVVNADGDTLSATSIDMAGDKAYVSYHLRGAAFDGCLEVVDFTGNTVNLISSLRAEGENARDFNHIMVDGNQVITTGSNNARGAFLATIPLENGVFGAETALQAYDIEGNDANCVVRTGDNYIVASTQGFTTLSAFDFATLAFTPTEGIAKHVNVDAQGNMVTLALANSNGTAINAVVSTYAASDATLATPLSTMSDQVITPTNGKNVSKIDGNNVYVCLGNNGVACYENGIFKGRFGYDSEIPMDNIKYYRANGIDYDDKYVYVAYGEAGLHIFDKTTLNWVCGYKYSGGKSANYVKVNNGIIYVAYGQSSVQVFSLRE